MAQEQTGLGGKFHNVHCLVSGVETSPGTVWGTAVPPQAWSGEWGGHKSQCLWPCFPMGPPSHTSHVTLDTLPVTVSLLV